MLLCHLSSETLKFLTTQQIEKGSQYQGTLQCQQVTHAGHSTDDSKHHIEYPQADLPFCTIFSVTQPQIHTEEPQHQDHMGHVGIAHLHMRHHGLGKRQQQQTGA